jgi:hypothetical protein
MNSSFLGVLLVAVTTLPAADWHAATWNGEAAWVGQLGNFTATVSVPRGRLISLRSDQGTELLYAGPAPLTQLVAERSLLAGHQQWLGPQSAWNWPPPRDWEQQPPALVTVAGETLTIIPTHLDAGLPATCRSYRLAGEELAATLAWDGSGTGTQWAMHVLQVPMSANIRLQAASHAWAWGDDSNGFAQQPPGDAVPGVTRHADGLGFTPIDAWRKYFAPAQDIVCTYPDGSRLTMARGAAVGTVTSLPDAGLVSQVFVGKPDYGRQEIEQMSPILRGPHVSYTILLQPHRF